MPSMFLRGEAMIDRMFEASGTSVSYRRDGEVMVESAPAKVGRTLFRTDDVATGVVFRFEERDFIVREKGSRTREKFSMEMERNNIRWNPAWECHNTQTIKNAVDAGLGIGVLSKLSVRKRLESGRFRALNVFDKPLELYIRMAYAENKYFSQNLTAFRDYAVRRVGVLAMEKNT